MKVASVQKPGLDGKSAHAESSTAATINLLFIISGLDLAGPELRLLEFVRRFPQTFRLHIAVVGENVLLREEFVAAGAHVIHCPIARPYIELAKVRKLEAYAAQHRIKIISSFDLKTLIVALLIKRSVVGTSVLHHLISLWDETTGARRHVYRSLLKFADALVCNGHAIMESIVMGQRLQAPAHVIPNGVDLVRFAPSRALRAAVRKDRNILEEEFVFGTVSNIRPVKNLPGLLHAFNDCAARDRSRLMVVGGGPGYVDAQRVAAELELTGRVVFTGSQADPYPFIAALDVFVLPSLSEGNPNVIVQAMSCAVPVIASAVGEIPHLLAGGVGVTVPAGDVATLSAAMTSAASDQELCKHQGELSRSAVARKYSIDAMIQGYTELFAQLARA